MKVKFDHCVIAVSDWDRAHAFYRDVLGAEIIRNGPGWAYRFGDVQVNLHGPGVPGEPNARLPVQPGGGDLCFEWPADPDSARAHLESHGVEVELGPVERHGAKGTGTSLYFRDPDGSLLELICYGGRAPA